MAEMALDPSKGYVALPLDILDLELSPGAFRTLVEFCRMADREGFCWPSLSQLGDRLGRSRAAISGYVAELREIGVLETIRQRTANGFNARLKFRVTFWAEWRAKFSKTGKSTERRVKPAERSIEDTNHNHKNHTPVDSGENKDLVTEWRGTVGQAPYPDLSRSPDPALIERTEQAVAKPVISADIKSELSQIYARKKIPIADAILSEQAKTLGGVSPEGLRKAFADIWQSHWRRPPMDRQFAEIAAAARNADPALSELALLRSYLRRYELAQRRLRPVSRYRTVTPETAV